MNIDNTKHVDQVLFDLCGVWANTNKIYDDAREAEDGDEVASEANALMAEIEGRICDHEAATVDGACVKLRLVEAYLDPMNCHEGRASALAMSFARDMSAIIRTPGTLPLRPLVS